jgi:predicted DNA-binding antitoxin AbrB/MazE fold protein
MGATFKARFTNGVLKPLEEVSFREGEEVEVTVGAIRPSGVLREPTDLSGESLKESFGGWVGVVDCQELKRMLYEARELGSRPSTEYHKI